MSWARSLLVGIAFLLAHAFISSAHAQTACVPNPNANGPLFVNGCPIPASGLNVLAGNVGVGVTGGANGAKCDGVTDDTAAINAKIAAATNAAVKFPPNRTCVVAGTLTIANTGVTLAGAGGIASTILFTCASCDSIDWGFQASQIFGGGMRDLYLNHSGKTGGTALAINFVAQLSIFNVEIDHAWNGISVEHSNTIECNFCIVNATTTGNSFGIKWFGAASAGDRSDALYLKNSIVQMNGSGGDCLVTDGNVNTLDVEVLKLLSCAYGYRQRNTAASSSFYPNFATFKDLQVDGGTKEGVRIEGGRYLKITAGSDINNRLDTNTADCTIDVLPDTGVSITTGILIDGSHVHDGPGSIACLNAKDINVTGSYIFDGGHGGTNLYPAIDVGAAADRVTIDGDNIGLIFGQPFTSNYGVQVENGAAHVVLGYNNYSGNGTNSYNILTPISNVEIGGGIAFNGGLIRPNSYSATPSNPTGTTSTAGVMMGLAGTFTPRISGVVNIQITGDIGNNTASDGGAAQIRTGTGSAPANGGAAAGTACGSGTPARFSIGASASATTPFTLQCTLNLPFFVTSWIDIDLSAITGGTASIANLTVSASEL